VPEQDATPRRATAPTSTRTRPATSLPGKAGQPDERFGTVQTIPAPAETAGTTSETRFHRRQKNRNPGLMPARKSIRPGPSWQDAGSMAGWNGLPHLLVRSGGSDACSRGDPAKAQVRIANGQLRCQDPGCSSGGSALCDWRLRRKVLVERVRRLVSGAPFVPYLERVLEPRGSKCDASLRSAMRCCWCWAERQVWPGDTHPDRIDPADPQGPTSLNPTTLAGPDLHRHFLADGTAPFIMARPDRRHAHERQLTQLHLTSCAGMSCSPLCLRSVPRLSVNYDGRVQAVNGVPARHRPGRPPVAYTKCLQSHEAGVAPSRSFAKALR